MPPNPLGPLPIELSEAVVEALSVDLIEAMVGALFLAIGLAAIAAGLSARPQRERPAVWFGVFCLLYGVRLWAKSTFIEAQTPWPELPFQYLDAFVTYTILIPGGLFMEALFGPGKFGIIRRLWQATCVCAVAAVVNDLARGQPHATMWLNPPVVLLNLLIQLAHVVAWVRNIRWSIELRAVVATGTLLTFIAIIETLSARGLFGGRLDLEPIAMLLFISALGWFLLARAREQAYGFVALSRELELARDIQQSLLPKRVPVVPGLRIQGAYLPMSAVAGDFYDVTRLADERVVVIVADVSGHGVPAALVASMVKVAFAAELERHDQPGHILGGINRTLAGTFEHAYITACCVVIDHPRRIVAYAAAGHPPSLLRRQDGRLERLEEGGIVLTLFPTTAYATVEVPFQTGDRLLIFTDGLLEAPRDGGDEFEFFGDAELGRIVATLPRSADVAETVLGAHRNWIGRSAPLSDDVTLVVVEAVS